MAQEIVFFPQGAIMLFKSQVFTQASGSIGGMTFSHNSSGMYTRGRTIPTNPNSQAQAEVRSTLALVSQRWGLISQANRDSWSNYAAVTPVTNVLGDSILLSGQQMFVRCNTLRVRGGGIIVDDGPNGGGHAELTLPNVENPGGFLAVTTDPGDTWANEDTGGLVIQTSRGMKPTINFFKSPFRFATVIPGSSTTAPVGDSVSPDAFGQSIEDTKAYFLRFTAFDSQGRISPSAIVRVANIA